MSREGDRLLNTQSGVLKLNPNTTRCLCVNKLRGEPESPRSIIVMTINPKRKITHKYTLYLSDDIKKFANAVLWMIVVVKI